VFSSLDSVDLVYTGPDGRVRWLQSDHRRPAQIEAEAEMSLLFALIRLTDPRRSFPADAPPPVLEYRCQHMPPMFLRAAIAGAGAELYVDGPVDFAAPAPDPEALAGLAFAALAARVEGERGVARDLDGLARLEREQPTLDLATDEVAYWRAVVGLAAVTGEVLRARIGGQWRLHADAGTFPLVLIADGRAPLDPLGAAIDLVDGADPRALTALVTAAT
jgi:hypothetical protein